MDIKNTGYVVENKTIGSMTKITGDKVEIFPYEPPEKIALPKDITTDCDEPMNRYLEKLNEVRSEEYGPKFDDLSKADRKNIEKEIEKMKENETYGSKDNVVKDPEKPGVEYQQVGDFVETKLTLYDGLTFDELPSEDQEEVLDYEKNVAEIENSTLSPEEKAKAIKNLDKPDCMKNVSYEYRYEKGYIGNTESKAEDSTKEEPTENSNSKVDSTAEKPNPELQNSKWATSLEKPQQDE